MVTVGSLMSLTGRSALITGAAGHLGKTISETLAELGCELILVDLPGTGLDKICEEHSRKWGVKAEYQECNLEFIEDRKVLSTWVLSHYKELNILINNAAFVGTTNVEGWNEPIQDQSVETWRRAIEVNLTSCFDLCKNLAPLIENSNGGSIINIGSIYGLYAPDWNLYKDTSMGNPAAYAVSKAGLMQLTKWLATTLAPTMRVNAISPGGIFRNQDSRFVERYVAKTPMQRMATEEDFKGVITFLATDLSLYVTGQVIQVDGGWGIW